MMRFDEVCIILLIGLISTSTVFCFTSYFSSFYDSITNAACGYIECCNRRWENDDFYSLRNNLEKNVFGQHIAIELIVHALKAHLSPSNPKTKALTISLHGRPGVGKNYVVSFIHSRLFELGYKSKFYHFYSGPHHFPLEREVPVYKTKLAEDIRGSVSKCEYSLFVFDEVHKMPAGVLDALKPFIDFHGEIDGVDYRRAIFIFISNTGGDEVGKHYLDLWRDGKKRQDTELHDFENILRLVSFNKQGGFLKSATIENSLIDHYVPFLPLEEEHVKQCIAYEFKKRDYSPTSKEIMDIFKYISFGPDENPVLADNGCKTVPHKVAAYVEKKRHWSRSDL